jgi:hypothetical protein
MREFPMAEGIHPRGREVGEAGREVVEGEGNGVFKPLRTCLSVAEVGLKKVLLTKSLLSDINDT